MFEPEVVDGRLEGRRELFFIGVGGLGLRLFSFSDLLERLEALLCLAEDGGGMFSESLRSKSSGLERPLAAFEVWEAVRRC